jgi:hypothetical protein
MKASSYFVLFLITVISAIVITHMLMKNHSIEKFSQPFNKDFLDGLYTSDVNVRNQSYLNCYDHLMKSGRKRWINKNDKNHVIHMKVLETMRTATHHLMDDQKNNMVITDGCVIPTEVGKVLYDIDNDMGNCVIKGERGKSNIELTPSPTGCLIDLSNNKYNKGKFADLLETAFNVYDRENFKIIDDLNNQIDNLVAEIQMYKDIVRHNEEERDRYRRQINDLNHPNSECSFHRRENDKLYNERRHYDAARDAARNRYITIMNMYYEIITAIWKLIEEYNRYIQYK